MTQPDLLAMLATAYAPDAPHSNFPLRGSAAGHCPRKLSTLLTLPPTNTLSPKAIRIFEDGTARGASLAQRLAQAWQPNTSMMELPVWTAIPVNADPRRIMDKILRSFDFEHASDIPVRATTANQHDGTIDLRSHCDIVLACTGNEDCHLVEIKGKGSWGMKSLPKEGPGDEYIAQAWMQITGLRQSGYIVQSAQFLFENKDTQEWVPWPLDLTTGLPLVYLNALVNLGSILTAFAEPNFSADCGTPIHALGVVGKLPWQCNYCSVGPVVGNCVTQGTLKNAAPSAPIPRWEVQ